MPLKSFSEILSQSSSFPFLESGSIFLYSAGLAYPFSFLSLSTSFIQIFYEKKDDSLFKQFLEVYKNFDYIKFLNNLSKCEKKLTIHYGDDYEKNEIKLIFKFAMNEKFKKYFENVKTSGTNQTTNNYLKAELEKFAWVENNEVIGIKEKIQFEKEFTIEGVKLVKRNKSSAIGENDGKFYTFRKKDFPQLFEKRVLELY
jgi:hypothetical protein